MARDTDLTANDDAIPDFGAPTDADLGDQEAMFADPDIVANLHLIINFCALPDQGATKPGTINRGIGSDIDIRRRDHISHLRHPLVGAIQKLIAVTIRPDHTTRQETITLSDLTVIPHHDPGKQMGTSRNFSMFAHMHLTLQNGSIHHSTFVHDAERADTCFGRNGRLRVHHCGGVNSRSGHRHKLLLDFPADYRQRE